MNKSFLKKMKDLLEKERKAIEEELEGFATKDERLKKNWNTKFPKFNGNLEEEADEVEEYNNLLSVEYSLENHLKDINVALEKIKRNQYGKCEKCGKEISQNRLIACPEAKTCNSC